MPPAVSLKTRLIDDIESCLTEELNQGGKCETKRKKKNEVGEVKIADVVFSFNNHKLIKGLQERGKLIASQNFDAMRAKEKEIQSLFDSQEEFKDVTRPTGAFVTFEEEDAKLVAMRGNDTRSKTFFGHKLVFHEASEPTDIIWENRHWTRNQTFWREIRAWIVIGFLMTGSFVFIYWVSSLSSEIARVFPTVDCPTLITNYGDQLDEFAVADYDFVEANPGM